jgi:pimeloyl-ACP methyl ester carboxylesterase
MQFLLIHGGWQGGWCWDGVVAELVRRGHTAIAPTLPGLEPAAKDRSGVGLSTFIEHATAELVSHGMSDVVVIGHSGGGPVSQGVAENVVERVRLIGFLDATVLHHASACSTFPRHRGAPRWKRLRRPPSTTPCQCPRKSG